MEEKSDKFVLGISNVNMSFNDNKYKIIGRVKQNANIRLFSNDKTEFGKLLSCDVFDNTGTIRIVAFGKNAEKHKHLFKAGDIISIENGMVTRTWEEYRNNNEYEIKLTEYSVLKKEIINKYNIPLRQHIKSFKELEKLVDNTLVDVVGMCTMCEDSTVVFSPRKSEEVVLRKICIMDSDGVEIKVTLWGETAEEFVGSVGDVIAIINSYTSHFNGERILENIDVRSDIEVNPDWGNEFNEWFFNDGKQKKRKDLSQLIISHTISRESKIRDKIKFYKKILRAIENDKRELNIQMMKLKKKIWTDELEDEEEIMRKKSRMRLTFLRLKEEKNFIERTLYEDYNLYIYD